MIPLVITSITIITITTTLYHHVPFPFSPPSPCDPRSVWVMIVVVDPLLLYDAALPQHCTVVLEGRFLFCAHLQFWRRATTHDTTLLQIYSCLLRGAAPPAACWHLPLPPPHPTCVYFLFFIYYLFFTSPSLLLPLTFKLLDSNPPSPSITYHPPPSHMSFPHLLPSPPS